MSRALIVDDDAFFVAYLDELLTLNGFADIAHAASGREAEAILRMSAIPPDVICVDMCMPEMDGMELIYRMKQLRYEGMLVFISGAAEQSLAAAEIIARTLGLNVLGVLSKPVMPVAFAQIVSPLAPSAQHALT